MYEIWVANQISYIRGKTCQEEGFVALLLCHAKPCQEIEIVVLVFKFGCYSQGTSKGGSCGLVFKVGFLIVSLLPKEGFLGLCNEKM